MTTVSVPWAMWYGDDELDLTFPDTWSIYVAQMKGGGADIGDDGIRRALVESIGAPPLKEVARGRRDAAILIDDLSRPTPSYRILPIVLEELSAGGLEPERVRIICAMGSHRPLMQQDFIKKIGLDLVERLQVTNHYAHDNLEFYGNSSQGIPIWVNRDFARSDLKIAAGMISPRAGLFGGGSKLVAIGASSWQTIYATHVHCPPKHFRQHLEEVGHIVGLEYIINPLLNKELGVMALVAGHPQKAFQHGVEIGKDLYRTEIPKEMDIVVCNAWPKDTEGTQASIAQVPLYTTQRQVLKEGSTVVLTSSCSEGLGSHTIFSPGSSALSPYRSALSDPTPLSKARHILFSPNLNEYDVRAAFGEKYIFCKTWSDVVTVLEGIHGNSPKVVVFPNASIQFGGHL